MNSEIIPQIIEDVIGGQYLSAASGILEIEKNISISQKAYIWHLWYLSIREPINGQSSRALVKFLRILNG